LESPVSPAPAAVQDAIAENQGWGPILGEGNLAFSEGRYEDARRVYVRAMLIDERDGYAKMLYAWANFALGDYQLAATATRRALLTSPDLVRYPSDIRLHYRDLVALEQQVDALQSHVAAHPSDREAGLLLGYLFYSIGDLPRGLAAFNDLAAGDATDPTVAALQDAAATAANAELRGN
jgi:tetratricopeptide (TPR) repeat protein